MFYFLEFSRSLRKLVFRTNFCTPFTLPVCDCYDCSGNVYSRVSKRVARHTMTPSIPNRLCASKGRVPGRALQGERGAPPPPRTESHRRRKPPLSPLPATPPPWPSHPKLHNEKADGLLRQSDRRTRSASVPAARAAEPRARRRWTAVARSRAVRRAARAPPRGSAPPDDGAGVGLDRGGSAAARAGRRRASGVGAARSPGTFGSGVQKGGARAR